MDFQILLPEPETTLRQTIKIKVEETKRLDFHTKSDVNRGLPSTSEPALWVSLLFLAVS